MYEACGRKDLLVARTLPCGGRKTVPVEVMNPTAKDVYLYKGMHVTVAVPGLRSGRRKYSEPDLPASRPCGETEDRRGIKSTIIWCGRDGKRGHVPNDVSRD